MNTKKKILITGGRSMLAYDFIRTQSEKYEIISVEKEECDITSFESIIQCISFYEPDILLNCAAYTSVDDAEDIGMKLWYDINTLGSYHLARATSAFWLDCIMISTDYVFDGTKSEWYLPNDTCNPINAYGMSKYLGEKLIQQANSRAIIVRTSWLYGGNMYGNSEWVFQNFVNSMLRISEDSSELKVVNDQHSIPTSCVDLSTAIAEIIENIEERDYDGQIFHLTNSCEMGGVTWVDFAREIFLISGKSIQVNECTSWEYWLKAKRPKYSFLRNNSDISLGDWKMALRNYLEGK